LAFGHTFTEASPGHTSMEDRSMTPIRATRTRAATLVIVFVKAVPVVNSAGAARHIVSRNVSGSHHLH
jgi:hypothetical protein